jgi:glycosyltransferase involved in cell wall biosynthesis
MSPKITVLMPVYNGAKYLSAAIISILNQNFIDFEFLIINDGSTDETVNIIKSYQDKRINFINNQANSGLVTVLNQGLLAAQGKYIARMDADDISLPDRLKLQFEFMENNPEVGVCGTWVKNIYDDSKKITAKYHAKHNDIAANLLFNASFAHPTIMFRKELVVQGQLKYNENYRHSEDYELWTRLVGKTKLNNLPKFLLLYRKHQASICSEESDTQKSQALALQLELFRQLGIEPTDKEKKNHQAICQFKINSSSLDDYRHWLLKIKNANDEKKIYDNNSIKKILAEKWLVVCQLSSPSPTIWKQFAVSEMRGWLEMNFSNYLRQKKLFLNCLFDKRLI